MVLIFGAGKIAVDALLTRRFSGRQIRRSVSGGSTVAVQH
jgi:hypothetical protein